ncbi:MAG: hypothetical protein WAZ19_01085 [Anaerolineae bacterium]
MTDMTIDMHDICGRKGDGQAMIRALMPRPRDGRVVTPEMAGQATAFVHPACRRNRTTPANVQPSWTNEPGKRSNANCSSRT